MLVGFGVDVDDERIYANGVLEQDTYMSLAVPMLLGLFFLSHSSDVAIQHLLQQDVTLNIECVISWLHLTDVAGSTRNPAKEAKSLDLAGSRTSIGIVLRMGTSVNM